MTTITQQKPTERIKYDAVPEMNSLVLVRPLKTQADHGNIGTHVAETNPAVPVKNKVDEEFNDFVEGVSDLYERLERDINQEFFDSLKPEHSFNGTINRDLKSGNVTVQDQNSGGFFNEGNMGINDLVNSYNTALRIQKERDANRTRRAEGATEARVNGLAAADAKTKDGTKKRPNKILDDYFDFFKEEDSAIRALSKFAYVSGRKKDKSVGISASDVEDYRTFGNIINKVPVNLKDYDDDTNYDNDTNLRTKDLRIQLDKYISKHVDYVNSCEYYRALELTSLVKRNLLAFANYVNLETKNASKKDCASIYSHPVMRVINDRIKAVEDIISKLERSEKIVYLSRTYAEPAKAVVVMTQLCQEKKERQRQRESNLSNENDLARSLIEGVVNDRERKSAEDLTRAFILLYNESNKKFEDVFYTFLVEGKSARGYDVKARYAMSEAINHIDYLRTEKSKPDPAVKVEKPKPWYIRIFGK